FAPGQIPAGPTGPQGPPGPAGPAGPRAPWGFVGKGGKKNAPSPHLHVSINHPSPRSSYLTLNSGINTRAFLVTPAFRDGDAGFKGSYNVSACGSAPLGSTCPASGYGSSSVYVGMFDRTNSFLQDHSFYFVMF